MGISDFQGKIPRFKEGVFDLQLVA
jgi:hypothetical protein